MTVRMWCESVPLAGSLVIIRRGGWKVAAAYIDNEDLFRLPSDIAEATVLEWSDGEITLTDSYGVSHNAPCIFLDIEL